MRAERLAPSDVDALRVPLAEQKRFLPFGWYREVKAAAAAELVRTNLRKAAERSGQPGAWQVIGTDTVQAVATVERLEWDSRHFGFPVSRIDHLYAFGSDPGARGAAYAVLLAQVCAGEEARGTRYLVTRIAAADVAAVHALEDAGFRLLETLVFASIRARDVDFTRMRRMAHVRDAREEDLPALAAISREAFARAPAYDRFHADPLLPQEKCDELMGIWPVSSYHGFADFVLTAEKEGRPVGYMTAKRHRELWDALGYNVSALIMSGVSPKGTGAYAALVVEATTRLVADEAERVQASTQVYNTSVLNTWEFLGFRVNHSELTYRRWLGPPSL